MLSSVKDILEVFGGHKVAAGLTLNVKYFDEFCNRASSYILENINTKAFIPISYYDIELNPDEINDKFFDDLKVLEPCGCENQKPKFLVKSNNAKIVPLKVNSLHAYIHINKKLHLLFFNYLKEAPCLNFGDEYNFIFEFQSNYNGLFKGIIKTFSCGHKLKDSADNYLNALKLNQLNYCKGEKKEVDCKVYDSAELINFVVNCASNAFGTCFVTFNTQVYKNFCESYNLSNIYEINFVNANMAGFNAINVCPSGVDFAKSYQNIIFLDSVLDKSYLQEIKKNSNANIYIPKINNMDKKLFEKIDLNRHQITEFYLILLKKENMLNASIFGLYSQIYKENKNINFNNFVIYFNIFLELNIIILRNENGLFSYSINKQIKTDLNKSSIYNTANLIRRIYE